MIEDESTLDLNFMIDHTKLEDGEAYRLQHMEDKDDESLNLSSSCDKELRIFSSSYFHQGFVHFLYL